MTKHRLWIIGWTAVGLVSLLLLAQGARGKEIRYTAAVIAAHDADTYTRWDEELGGVPLRLACADAPEKPTPRRTLQPGANQAARFAARLVLGEKVLAAHVGGSYRREIVHVALPDGRDLAAVLVRAGWAWAEVKYPYCRAKAAELLRLEAEARAAKRGLWGLPGKPVRPCRWRGKECE